MKSSVTLQVPKKKNPLPVHFEVVVKTLVDQAVTFAVSGTREQEATQWVVLNTHSHPAELEQADFIFDSRCGAFFCLSRCCSKAFEGTFDCSRKGATIVINCGSLAGNTIPGSSASSAAEEFVPQGDKVYRVVVKWSWHQRYPYVYVDRSDWIEARRDRADEYPCGVDFVLVDVEGHVVGIPRTKNLSVEKEGAAWDM